MAVKLTHPVAILNIVELVITIITAGLISGLFCTFQVAAKGQFIDGIVYGYLIAQCLLVMAIFMSGNIDKISRVILSVCGSVLWLAAAALLFEATDTGLCIVGEFYDRAVAAGVMGLALCIIHVLDAYFVWRHLDIID